MKISPGSTAVRHLRSAFDGGAVAGLTDAQLLDRFARRAGDEAASSAFAALVERHGPMVLQVCRSALRDEHDAQDAFQTVFLVLVRKAHALWVRDSHGPWLHGVALRTAARARAAALRRRAHETRRAESARTEADDPAPGHDLLPLIHEEIGRLPDRYRTPLVLCDLEGLSHEQAAGQLGWPVGTVKSRQSRGRERLRGRLLRRGVTPAAGLSALSIAKAIAAPPSLLAESTRDAAIARAGPPSVVSLADGVIRSFALDSARRLGLVLASLVAIAAGEASLRNRDEPPPAQPPPAQAVRPDRPIAAPAGKLFALRLAADAVRDAPSVAQALGPDGLTRPPAGYRWLRVGSGLTDRDGLVIREQAPMGGMGGFGGSMETRFLFVLVKIEAREITERDLIDLKTTDEQGRSTLVYQLSPDGARRLAALTRANLPDALHPKPARLAIALSEIVMATIPIDSEIRDGCVVDPGAKVLGMVQYAKDRLDEVAATNDGRPSPRVVVDRADEVREAVDVDIPVLAKANRVVIRWHDGRERQLDRPSDIEALRRALHPRLLPMRIGPAFATVSFFRDDRPVRSLDVHANGSWAIVRRGYSQTGIDPDLPALIRRLVPP